MELKGKRVTIMGLGKSGKALAAILHKEGAAVFISDMKDDEALKESLQNLSRSGIEYETGGHTSRVYRDRDLIIISPGVSMYNEVLQQARRQGVPVIGEIELAYHFAGSIPMIAVTGTNGKSTTVSLIHHLISLWGKKSLLAGNIGTPLAGEIYEHQDTEWIVAEVSSFQLETIASFRPFLGMVLNITSDHIDRHRTMDEYIGAKGRLFENQRGNDFALFNAACPGCMQISRTVPSQCYFFSSQGPVDRGAFIEGKEILWRDGGQEIPVLSLDEIPLSGVHNVENVLALVAAGRLLGVPGSLTAPALTTFAPLHHRIEFVAAVRGVDYYDDSKGTNPGAVMAAIRSFSRPVVLIAGGKDKNMDFDEMGNVIAGHTRALVVIGETADKIAAAAAAHGMKEIRKAGSLRDALDISSRLAVPGDVVLLSPACASFDMFRSAEERGDIFKSIVKEMEASPC